MNLLQEASRALQAEIDALTQTLQALDRRFEQTLDAIEKTHKTGKKLIFSGIGKNVFIAQKLAATFNSTGVEALYLDPLAAMHGDLGLCKDGDLALLMSNSGESEEVLTLVPMLKRLGVQTVGVTKNATSRLAQCCDGILTYQVSAEACPLNLAPTASTTVVLALGDALAMVYLKKRGFKEADFARFHPAGTLGRTLLLRVCDVMRAHEDIAIVSRGEKIIDALSQMTEHKTGLVVIIEEDGKVAGIFTDGDFRRLALKNPNPLQEKIDDHMNRAPKTIQADAMAVDALKKFQECKVDDLLVIDEHGFPVGLLDSQDLPGLKLV